MTSMVKRVENGWQCVNEAGEGIGLIYPDMNLFGLDFLMQTKVWKDRQGVKHPLEEMDLVYLINVRRFLLRRARHLEMLDGLAFLTSPFALHGEHALDAIEREMDERAEDPEAWLRHTPLMMRITELIRDKSLS